jgi:hypothetical protein
VERDEKNIVSHVSALARRRQDDDVFTRHVSDAGPKRASDVHRPHGSETLQLHTVRALTASATYLLIYIMSSQSNENLLRNFTFNNTNVNNGRNLSNTDQAGSNWARKAINNHHLTTVTNLRWLMGHMHSFYGPSKWYRGGRREIMKKINTIRNRRVKAARTAAANLRGLRRLRTIGGLVNREVGTNKRRRFK